MTDRENKVLWRVLNDGNPPFTNEEIKRVMKTTCTPLFNFNIAVKLREDGYFKRPEKIKEGLENAQRNTIKI